MEYRWEATDLFGAVEWMAGKTLDKGAKFEGDHPIRSGDGNRTSMAGFTDGSWCIVESRCNGPYSDVTPDIDWEPPVFWLGEPET